jgi:hypothetical protein
MHTHTHTHNTHTHTVYVCVYAFHTHTLYFHTFHTYIQVKDLEFVADFKVQAHRAGTCHAMLTWFDTIFREKCDREVTFTTGPHVS